MFPYSPVLLIYLLAIQALLGAALGLAGGTCAAILLKNGWRGVVWDALIGSVSYLLAFVACVFIPIGPNTIHYTLPGGVTVSSTMNTYQHPLAVAAIAAVVLPIGREAFRLRRKVSS